MSNHDELTNSLAVYLAHLAETKPVLIAANCVYGSDEKGLLCTFSVFVPSSKTLAEWQADAQPAMSSVIAELKRHGINPMGAIRFIIPGAVIERCGVRDAIGTCMRILDEVVEGKLASTDEVNGLPMHYCFVVEKSSQDDDGGRVKA